MPGRSTRMTNSHTACRTMLKRTATQSIRNVLLSRSLQCQRTSIYRLELYLNHKTAPTVLRIPWSTRPFSSSSRLYTEQKQSDSEPEPTNKPSIRENIYTLPNLLTLSRICACPVLGWSILDGNYHLATGLLVYAGLTDLVSLFYSRSFVQGWRVLEGRRIFGTQIQDVLCPRNDSGSCGWQNLNDNSGRYFDDARPHSWSVSLTYSSETIPHASFD